MSAPAPSTTPATSGADARLPGALAMFATWAATRALVVTLAVTSLGRGTLFNDPNLLWSWANGTPFAGEDAPELGEYPGAARVLALSGRLAANPEAFGWGWIGAMLLVDLGVLLVLRRQGTNGAWFWVVAGAALGPVVWLRYDLLVALAALGAVVLRRRRPGLAGVLLAVAVLLKLWPIVLVPALLLRGRWRRWVVGATSALAVGVLGEVLLRGLSSLTTPLTYQAERGLQIESLFATPALLAGRGGDPTEVWEFAFRAYQVSGSDGTVASAVAVVVLAASGIAVLLAIARCPADRLDTARAVGASLMAVLAVASNSVFSPQYVMWFIPLVALVIARQARPDWALMVTGLLTCGLTQAIWPWGYPDLLLLDGGTLAVLAVRNVLVVVLAGLLAWRLVRTVSEALPAESGAQPVRNDSRT